MSHLWENEVSKIQKECLKYSAVRNLPKENIVVKDCLEAVENSLKYKKDVDHKIRETLERLKSEFDKNFDSRIYAAQNGAYDVILEVLTNFDKESKIVCLALKDMIMLTSCQKNLITEKGIKYQMSLLKSEKNLPNVQLVLRWMKHCCIKSEKNRQDIFNARIIDELKDILNNKHVNGSKLLDICALIKSLTLDYDVEFDYGNSVDRAKDIGNEILVELTILLEKFKENKKVLNGILQTVIILLVEDGYCKKVENAGGINCILDTMRSFPDDENLNCLILRLIKVLTRNDDVKIHLATLGAASLVITAMARIQTGAMAIAGLSCMAALTFGSPRNSRIFYNYGAPCLIIETMKRYPGSLNVQSYGARTISNMGIKNEIDSEVFLNFDVEVYLEMAMKIHGDKIEGDIKAAFTNLGLNPELKDHWTKTPKKKQEIS